MDATQPPRVRAQTIVPSAVDATRIDAPTLPFVDRADPPGKQVLCSGEWPLRPRLLLGIRRLAWHLAVHPDVPIDVLLLPDLDPADEAAIRKLDVPEPPRAADLIRGYGALRRAGVQLAQIRELAPHRKHLPDISAIATLAGRVPEATLDAMARNPRLSIGHVKAFVKLPLEAQERLARVIATAGRPGDLIKKAGKKAAGDEGGMAPDLSLLEAEIGMRLGTSVSISASASDGSFTIAFDWSTIGDLQGLMKRLGDGVTPPLHRPARARRLILELAGNDEYEDLLQHLDVRI